MKDSEAVSTVCRVVLRAVEKLEEEGWFPLSLDVLLFHSHQLYRLLLAYCNDDEVLENLGRSITFLTEIHENIEDTSSIGYVADLLPLGCENDRGRPKFNISKEQIQHLLELHFSCPKIACLFDIFTG